MAYQSNQFVRSLQQTCYKASAITSFYQQPSSALFGDLHGANPTLKRRLEADAHYFVVE